MTKRETNRLTAVFLAVITITSVFAGSVAFSGAAAAAPGDALYRVNAGGETVAADDGPSWSGDWQQYHSGSDSTHQTDDAVTLGPSVPSGTPASVFQTEVYGDQQWTFSEGVQSGQQYEVRLYFAEIYADGDGERLFDVAVEGEQVLDDYDIHADVGHDAGLMYSYTVTPSDGTIDVDLTTVEDNAKLSAVEIVAATSEPNTLGGPSNVDFGETVVGDAASETVTVTNLGGAGDADVTIVGVSVSGDDAFSAGTASQTTLAPGESASIPVTFSPDEANSKSATLSVAHSGSNSPLTVDLSGAGTSTAHIGFGKSDLQGFEQGSLTALEFGPDGRLYVAQQDGTVFALEITREGENSYAVASQEAIEAVKDIPNHDDNGNYDPGESTRQVTGLTVGGTADQPVVYVSSSDPTIDVGTDDDDTDTNSGAISRLTFEWNDDGSLAGVDHDVVVLGLPRSEENHATNGLDLSADGTTLYVAQGGHTNQGAPSNNFGHTPEYALSAAILAIDLERIEQDYAEKSLGSYDPKGSDESYDDLTFLYAVPTIQNDDATDGDDLPFGGDDGANQAKWVEGGPVQVYSSGYRNPYDLVLSADGQLYAIDNGPNGGWGGHPVSEGPSGVCTNAPNDPGSGTGDQLHLATEGSYGGHPAPIRANPTGADVYDAEGDVAFDVTAANSPVPASKVNPVECDYQSPSEDNSIGDTFGWTGGIEEYTASNFGGQMRGDLLVVVGSSSVERVELNAAGDGVVSQEGNFFSDVSALGIAAQGDDGPFPGTVWTARGDLTVFEPNDYEGSGGDGGQQCTAADNAGLDEDGDGYDNADELDAGTDPCSAASTPADFDGDGTSNLNDADDDDDGTPDTADPFAVDPNDGTTTTLPVRYDFSETYLFGENGQGWTGLMTNGEDDYQDLYDPDQMTVGGAAQVLTVESVPKGDAVNAQNSQQYAFQFGVDAPEEPFTVSTTVNGLPESPENYQSLGVYVGTGDQDDYVKLVAAANGGSGGVQFAKETGGTFQNIAQPSDGTVAGPSTNTDLTLTVDPTTDPTPNDGQDDVAVTASYAVDGGETVDVGTGSIPAEWLDGSDGSGLAVGVISTSYGATSTFDATWTNVDVEYVNPPVNAPPVADAGADVTVEEGQQVTLDGSASADPDGDTIGYTWTQTAGSPSGLLDMSDGQQASFVAPDVDAETTLTFRLSVSDGEDSATDTVNVTVQDADTDGGDGDAQTVAEVVAGEDGIVGNAEIQQAVNWWATGAAVPGTDGATVGNAQIQQLVNAWATGSPVTTPEEETTGSALIEVTPDTGLETSTYGGGTYQVTNTGEKNISSVSFDLSTATLPDMVFDPQGTAGDPTGDGFTVASDGGTGIITTQGGTEAFSQPHNGQNADDGYDVMTVAFDDFQSGETATFWADNDPTSIKGATINSQEAGPVSGLELARSTVTVTYEDGTTRTAHLMGDGSAGGSTAVVTDEEAPAPTLGVQGVSLDADVLDARHGGATVSQADQTVTVTGRPGETVTLVRVEGELTLSNVPNGGYDVEAYEANDAEAVEYYAVTLDSNGEAAVPVSLTDTDFDGDGNAGYNYFVAAHGDAAGDAGDASNVVVLKYDESADAGDGSGESGTASADFAVTANGGIDASTYGGGSLSVTNTGEERITAVTFDLSASVFSDVVFDPQGTAGDAAAKGFSPDTGATATGLQGGSFAAPHDGQSDDGYDELTATFDDFDGGETFAFSVDVDPTSIKDAQGSGAAGSVSGLEMTGATVTVEYADGTTQTTFLFGDGSDGGAQATAKAGLAPAPTLGVDAVSLDSSALGARHGAATVSQADQTLTLSGPAGATVQLLRAEGQLELANQADGYDLAEFEANAAENVDYQTVQLGDDGAATVDVTLTNASSDGAEGGFNHFVAAVQDADGDTGATSNVVVLKYDEGADAGDGSDAQVLYRVNAGGDVVSATDDGPDWTGATGTSSPYLVSVGSNAGNYDAGADVTADDTVPPSTPDAVFDSERYGPMTWEFATDPGRQVEVRLYFANSFPGASEPGDRQFDVSVEDQQVLSGYDPVADVGHATGTMKTFAVTEDGDGTLTITFEKGAVENPEVRAIEILAAEGGA